MIVSNIFATNLTQHEVDFINIDISTDIALFLDPHRISKNGGEFCENLSFKIADFFKTLLDSLLENDLDEARRILGNLHEPNEYHLGLSQGESKGKAVGEERTTLIMDAILDSDAYKSGLLIDLEDLRLLIDGFGDDTMSDILCNILRLEFVTYTKNQCDMYGFTTTTGIIQYWDSDTHDWEQIRTELFIFDSRNIILVPKHCVSYTIEYCPSELIHSFAIEFFRKDHLRRHTKLVQTRANGDTYVTKKSIIELLTSDGTKLDKNWIVGFLYSHRGVFTDFKGSKPRKRVDFEKYETVNIREVCSKLKKTLQETATGTADASKYHSVSYAIIHLLFRDFVSNGKKEDRLHNGRKRVDITFSNIAEQGFLSRLDRANIPSQKIFIECKNYSTDIENPQLDQLAGRFSLNRGKFGIVMCRGLSNEDLFIMRCVDTYKDGRGLIIPITDIDIHRALDNIILNTVNPISEILQEKLDMILNHA